MSADPNDVNQMTQQMSQSIRDRINKIMKQYGTNADGSAYVDFSKVSAPDMSKVVGMNELKSQQDQLDLQLRLANQLQNGEQRGTNFSGTSVAPGSVYIPTNPMGTAMQMYSHLQGIMDAASGKKDQSALNAKMQDALDTWANILQGGSSGASSVPYSDGESEQSVDPYSAVDDQ